MLNLFTKTHPSDLFIIRGAGSASSFLIQSSIVQKWAFQKTSGVSTFIRKDSFCLKGLVGDFWITQKLNKLSVLFFVFFNLLILLLPVLELLKSRFSHRQRTKVIPFSKLFDLLSRF